MNPKRLSNIVSKKRIKKQVQLYYYKYDENYVKCNFIYAKLNYSYIYTLIFIIIIFMIKDHALNTLTLVNGKIPSKINYLQTKKAALILRALNHSLRYQILKLIDENEAVYVTQIYKRLKIEQSVASQHLAILRNAGIVNAVRDGKTIYYTPNYACINQVMALVTKMIG